MTFTKEFCEKAIVLENEDVIYTADQANITGPVRFPAVVVPLVSTYHLITLADKLRMAEGYRPMYALPEMPEIDQDGWYDFYIGVNGWSRSGAAPCVDNCISFVVVNSTSEDDEHEYRIELDEEEQRNVLARVDAECRRFLKKSCAELLREAEKEMEAS